MVPWESEGNLKGVQRTQGGKSTRHEGPKGFEVFLRISLSDPSGHDCDPENDSLLIKLAINHKLDPVQEAVHS